MSITVDQEYKEERTCTYKERQYRVRDNGAVMRLPKADKKAGKNDNVWTFGVKDAAGYLALAGVRVHLIVATAFLGEKPSNELVVDHIDTIRVNNRPSNLHYVTRFENMVANPLTRMKLEHATGLPIEKILEDLSVLHNLSLPPNLTWVNSVSQIEADILRMKMNAKLLSKPIDTPEFTEAIKAEPEFAIQADGWRPLGQFPFCPQHEDSSLGEYASNIEKGKPFFSHTYRTYIADEFALSEDGKTLAVKCSDPKAVKSNTLITVTYHSKKWFVHKCDRFFSDDGMKKYYTLALGKEWTGGDVIDDYCM